MMRVVKDEDREGGKTHSTAGESTEIWGWRDRPDGRRQRWETETPTEEP